MFSINISRACILRRVSDEFCLLVGGLLRAILSRFLKLLVHLLCIFVDRFE